jgi:AcrR family transcriptional regulator
MTRPPDPAIRAELAQKAVEYVLANGIADLSLRPLADAIGTSARMLIYHFGSREGLMRAILEGVREYGDARITAWMNSGSRTMPEFLRLYWLETSALGVERMGRLIFELYALALRDPKLYPGVLTEPLAYWRELARTTGVPTRRRDAEATLLLAATRGLLLDLCATGDRGRIAAAVKMLADFLEQSAPSQRRQRARPRTRGQEIPSLKGLRKTPR